MYYEGKQHGLPYDPLKAIITPRPIGWISTLDANGVANLAPYSFFNAVNANPGILVFSSEELKHSARNARDQGEFVFSLATAALTDAINISSDALPDGVSEYDAAKLEAAPCRCVAPPRVAASPASMECKTLDVIELRDQHGDSINAFLVIGQILATHIDDRYIVDGRFDTAAAEPLARCGYRDYAKVSETFELLRPTDDGNYTGVDR